MLYKVQEIKNNITGVVERKLSTKDKEISILYIPQLTDRNSLSENIIKPLLLYNGLKEITPSLIVKSIVYIDDIFIESDENRITDYIIEGKSVILLDESSKYIVANTLKVKQRNIEAPEVESSIRSPKDAFNENLDSNLSLIRNRIKDSSLKINYYKLGVRTKTAVAVIYIENVANPKYVDEIQNRIRKIKVEGILESGYVQKSITYKNTLFPQTGINERSDSACANILEGKICILVDGSNIALIALKNFAEFLDSGDDHYDNKFIGTFNIILRWISLIISLTLSALYVTVVAFQPDILPPQYILALASSRAAVPVSAVMEAIIMESILELLREATVRLPKQIGTSVSVVGTIVIGQAAVSAGLVSPLMIIIVSLSSMSSFVASDYTLMNPIRLLKFFMIIISGFFGLFGFVMGLSIIVIKITSITNLDTPYTVPMAPFNYKSFKNYILPSILFKKRR